MDFIPAKTILSGYSDGSFWFGVNYNMNIYRGCCHGCIYCDKRKTGVVGTGAMSDPYNPFEKEYRLTRGALELINRYRFGISIATKSDLVTRDIDILKEISKHSPVLVKITVTTADDELCKKLEPNAPLSSERFTAVKKLAEAGLFAGILLMPVLPFIEDTPENIKDIVSLAKNSGVKFIFPAFGVTLRQNQRVWFYDKLDELFPGMKEKYIKQFGNAYECRSPNAKELWQVFKRECGAAGILYQMPEIIAGYQQGYGGDQMSLFV